jgi:hypothetical protein
MFSHKYQVSPTISYFHYYLLISFLPQKAFAGLKKPVFILPKAKVLPEPGIDQITIYKFKNIYE